MFAVVRIAGKQFLAEVEKKLEIDAKIEAKKNKTIEISDVLLYSDDKSLVIGKPIIGGAKVQAEIVENKKDKKVLVVKHHSKKRYRRTKGHRQDKTVLIIKKIDINAK